MTLRIAAGGGVGADDGDEVRLTLTVPIPRAALRDPTDRSHPLMLDHAAWREQTAAIGAEDGPAGGLALTVLAEAPWTLLLDTGDAGIVEVIAGSAAPATAGGMSRRRLRYGSLKTVLSQAGPLGCFVLRQAGREVPLGAVHLETGRLAAGPVPMPPAGLPVALADDLNELAALQRGEPATRSVKPCRVLASLLNGWRGLHRTLNGESAGLRGEAATLAALIDAAAKPGLDPAAASRLVEAMQPLTGPGVMASLGLADVPLPPFAGAAWERVRAGLTRNADAQLVITAAVAGVRDRVQAQTAVPRALQRAVRCYSKAFVSGHPERAALIPIVEASNLVAGEAEPWPAVATTLHVMALLRVGCVTEFLKRDEVGHAPTARWLAHHLRDPHHPVGLDRAAWDLPHASPLPEDATLAALCDGREAAPPDAPSWLYTYVRWRLMHGDRADATTPTRNALRDMLLGSGGGCLLQQRSDGPRLRREVEGDAPQRW